MIAFTILGVAKPAGSKRAFPIKKAGAFTGKTVVVDANPNSRQWKNSVADAARAAYTGELLAGPLALVLRFVLPRPKGHFGRKGLLASAPAYPTTKPDTTKLIRGVEDALTKILWRDDAQVVQQRATKEYGEPARCEVSVVELAVTAAEVTSTHTEVVGDLFAMEQPA